jgi:predicted RNA-binding protein with TRAM domain
MATWHGLKEGDEIEIQITAISRLGEGVGRLDGCVIFIKGAKTGDRVKARITQLSARHAHAELIKRQ